MTITRPHLVDVTAHYLFLIGNHCLSSLCLLQQTLQLQTPQLLPTSTQQHRTRRLCLYTWARVFWSPVPPRCFIPLGRCSCPCKGHFQHFTPTFDKSTVGPQQPGTREYTWSPLSLTSIPWDRAGPQERAASWWPLTGQPPSPFPVCQQKVLVSPAVLLWGARAPPSPCSAFASCFQSTLVLQGCICTALSTLCPSRASNSHKSWRTGLTPLPSASLLKRLHLLI